VIGADLLEDLRRSFAAALDHDDAVKARRQLLAAGWLDALDADEPVAVAVLFRLQGRTLRDAACLDDVLARHLARLWPEAAGDTAIAYPLRARSANGSGITHVVLPGHREAQRLLWLDDLSGQPLQLVEVDGYLTGHAVHGIDPVFGLLGLKERPAGQATELWDPESSAVWDEALAAGRIAVAHQMIAGALALVETATAYSRHRKQFGAPIGAFQAVKHRLAETFVAISAADAAAVAAASNQRPTSAAIAKALAGRAAAVAARHCLQVFGGIGFTTEHEFHRYFRRNLVLERLLGDTRSIERLLGRVLRTGGLNDDRVVDLDHQPRIDVLPPLIGRSAGQP
jgi:hypothetical protein